MQTRMSGAWVRDMAFGALRDELCGLRKVVHESLLIHGPCTTRELAELTGLDLLVVRPRVTELGQAGLAEVVGRVGREGVWAAVSVKTALDRMCDACEQGKEQLLLGF